MLGICDKLLEFLDASRLEIDEIREWKFKGFKEAFEFHYTNCPEYKNYCKLHNLEPSDINGYDDLKKIKPIPSDVFRDSDKLILSVPESDIVGILTTSSTTSKKPVRFPMDKPTYGRMLKVNAKTWQTGHELKIGSVFFLAPKPTESDTGLVKGGYLTFKTMGFRDEDIYFGVRDNKLDCEWIVKEINNAKRPIHMYGPPFAYMALVDYLGESGQGLKLDEDSRVIMTGGWKTVKGEVTKEELNTRVSYSLRVDKKNIRDGYGSTDILTMLPECEYHKKHVPPWFHISVRDPKNIDDEVAEGEQGLNVLMSNFITSYPAFTMPGDMGIVVEKECECGRRGQIVELKGRAKGLGARGCAIRLEEFMEIITRRG